MQHKKFSLHTAGIAALAVSIFTVITMFFFTACTAKKHTRPLTMVFYPNESSEARRDAREAFRDILSKATGRKVDILTTTDYNIALEALVSGKADMAYIGAEGYITAHKRNSAIVPVATNSGPSGTLEDAKYYSFIAVKHKNTAQYKNQDGTFDLSKLKNKKIAFVSTSSTSGFVLPARVLAKAFHLPNTDSLIMEHSVFSKVIFAGSHQGAQVHLYREDVDAAAFAIPRTLDIYELIEGTAYQTGAMYRVTKNDKAPFNAFPGTEITVIKSIPVLNAPITINTQTVSAEDVKKIRAALTSEETARNPGIFDTKTSTIRGIYPKYSEKTKLVATSDAWYDEIRNMHN